MPFTAVHVPVKAPQEWLDRYQAGKIRFCRRERPVVQGVRGLRQPHGQRSGPPHRVAAPDRPDRDHAGSIHVRQWRAGEPDRRAGAALSRPSGGVTPPRQQPAPCEARRPSSTRAVYALLRSSAGPATLDPGRVTAPMHVSDWMPTITRLVGCEPAEDPQWDGIDAGADSRPLDGRRPARQEHILVLPGQRAGRTLRGPQADRTRTGRDALRASSYMTSTPILTKRPTWPPLNQE